MMLSEQEKMFAGLAHQPFCEELKQLRLDNKERLYEYNILTRPSDHANKARLISEILGKNGNNPNIVSPFYCDYGRFIEVGDNFFANYNCTILDSGRVYIGNNVLFAPNVSLYTVGHPLDAELRNQEWE
ncbi:maltose acetyltransferase-like protein [Cricetibacter osteomyelitidis]|uniref:Acetyltransferase n=1 Tax=Cricetibacter osteomyelitidis TaxID=1521931 RepID=A0A4R2SVE8_9PAST|nr:maltose acetyltransferase-like protein [Cricetibacter osteomyelitidis]